MNADRRWGAWSVLTLALAFTGCARDLTLDIPTAPRLTGLQPTQAYAGQLLTVSGSSFDADAPSNVVVFAHATARAHLRTDGGIVVRVPDGAGSGTVSVTTSGGTSDAFPGFVYLGAGQLRDVRIASQAPLLHKPRRLFGIGGAIYLDSVLNSGVLRLDDAAYFAPGGARQVPTAGGNLLYTMSIEVDVTTRGFFGLLRRFDVTGATPTVSRTVGADTWDNIGHVRRTGGDRLVALGPSPADSAVLAIWTLDPATLATVTGPTSTPTWISSQPRDAGNGQLVLVTLDDPAGTLALAVIDTSGAAPTYAQIPAAGHAFDRYTVALGTGVGSVGPVAPATLHRLAAVGLSNGKVAIADLDLATPAFEAGEIDTFSPSSCEALFFSPDGLQLLVTKPSDDIILGVDLATRKVAWSVQATQPTQMAARAGLVHVASRADNLVVILDPVARRQVGAIRADVVPGSSDASGGLAFMPGSPDPALAQYLPDALYFPTSHPTALLRYGLGSMSPMVSITTFPPRFTFMNPLDQVVWAAGPGQVGPPDIVPPDVYPLPATPRRTAFTAEHLVEKDSGHLLVGHDAGLSLVQAGLLGGQQWAGVTLDLAGFSSVGFLPGGAAYATASLWAGTRYCDGLVGWTLDRLKAGDADLRGGWFCDPATGLGRITASAVLEEGLWVFFDDEQGTTSAYLVDPAWNAGPDFTTPLLVDGVPYAPALSNATPSPNGRTIAHWEPGFRGGTDLLVHSADPASSFASIGFLHFEGTISGFTFDGSGERLFLLTRAPDLLYLIE